MSFTLRPDQAASVRALAPILHQTGSSIDASDCGLGKTYVAAGLCRELGLSPWVIAPKASLPSWQKVLESAGVPVENLMSWEKARRIKKFEHKQGRVFLFDEVHKAKNRKTANAKMLLKAAAAGRVHMMSATAIMDPLDMGAIGPLLGLFQPRDYWNWCRRNGCRDGFFGGLEFCGDDNILHRIHTQIFPAKGVRTRREDIPGFPECDMQVMELDLGEDVTKAYRAMAKEAGVRMDELIGDVVEADNPLTHNLRLRQMVELAKVPALIDIVREYYDAGVAPVLFLNFRESLQAVADAFPGCALIMGGRDNTAEIERFQTGQTHICIASMAIASTSISLHDVNGVRPRGGLLCPTDDPRAAEQAEFRLWRDGSKSKSFVYKIFAAGTVEAKMAEREREKRNKISIINNGMTTTTPAPGAKPKRKRSKFPPSSLENYEASPCFEPNRFESTPFTESGNRVHKCVELGNLTAAQDDEEAKLAEICMNYAAQFEGRVLKEHRLTIADGTYGLADLIVISGVHADMVDWKTGRNKQTPAEENFQQQAYVMGVFDEFKDVATITVHLVYPRLGTVSFHTYYRHELPTLRARFNDTVAAVEAARVSDTRTPSVACRNCAKQGTCPAMANKALTIAKRYQVDLDIPEFAIHPSTVTDPDTMGRLLDVKKVLEGWCESVGHHARKMALEDNIVPTGYAITHRAGKREIKDACAAYAAVNDVLAPDEFLRACSVSAAQLEKEFAAKIPKGKKKAAVFELSTRLADLGILNRPAETPCLQKASA